MSKEKTPLEALYTLVTGAIYGINRTVDEYLEYQHIIENALNKNVESELTSHIALEIIVKKKVDVNAVIHYLKMGVSDDQVCHWYNDCVVVDVDEEPERVLYEEDLICLKEVLL